MAVEVNIKALGKTSNKLRMSDADVHTVVAEYLRNVDKAPVTNLVAMRYGRNWYIVGERVNGKKNVPDTAEILE